MFDASIPIKRTFKVGRNECGNVWVEVKWDGERLSFSGVEGPRRNGDCKGGCGQITDSVRKLNPELADVWERWHLNDMRAGCEHQRVNWDTKAHIKTTSYGWGRKYYNKRVKASEGHLSREEYQAYQVLNEQVGKATQLLYESDLVKMLLDNEMLEVRKTEMKGAGWVKPSEHPNGLLCKPCEICGYEYGSKWLTEEVPDDVLEYIHNLPDERNDYPW